MNRIKELTKAIDILDEKIDEIRSSIDYSKLQSFEELEKIALKERKERGKLSRELRLLIKPSFGEIPDYGDLISLQDFIDCCNSGGFIDYDGYGYYATEDKVTDIHIIPSDVRHKEYRKEFSHVLWLNR